MTMGLAQPTTNTTRTLLGKVVSQPWRVLPYLNFRVRNEVRRRTDPDERYCAACHRLCEVLLDRTDARVFTGPFATTRVPRSGTFARTPSLIVGSYEEELHDAMTRIVSSDSRLVINIGSAEGYYCVGLARLMPHARVVAFEMNDGLWNECATFAELNGVSSRLAQNGACTHETLAQVGEEGAVVICDCEGAEFDLLDPERQPFLRTTTVICELHDFLNPAITGALVSRFRQTHGIELLTQTGRDPSRYPILDHMKAADKWLALHENRHIGGVQYIGRYLLLWPKGLGRGRASQLGANTDGR